MAGKVVVPALRILAVCLLVAVCFAAGTALSGLDKAAQQASPSTPNLQPPSGQQVTSSPPEAPANQLPRRSPKISYTLF